MKKILITGGGGFIGSYLANDLSKFFSVTIVDNFIRGDQTRLNKNIKKITADLTKINDFIKLDKHYDWIFHLAAVNGTDNFYDFNETVFNVGIKSILNIYDFYGDKDVSLVIASSAEVYQTPNTIPTPEEESLKIPDVKNPRYSYGGSKIFSELVAFNYNNSAFKKVLIFRPHNIYGPNMGYKHVIPQLIQKIEDANTNNIDHITLIGTGNETRAFCYVLDVVNGLKILMKSGADHEIYHIGNSDEEIKIIDLAKLIMNEIGQNLIIKPGKNIHMGGTSRRCPDVNKISLLGYKPEYNLNRGLKETVKWYINNIDNYKNKRTIE